MSFSRILLFTVILSYFIFNICSSTTRSTKNRTTSRVFQKLRLNNTRRCQYINNDFDKLQGYWYFTLRSVVPNTPMIRCGQLTVNKTADNGFESTLLFLDHQGEPDEVSVTGVFVNETVIEIPALNRLITGSLESNLPFIAQIGICDGDSIMFIEPIHYVGGGMVFTRTIFKRSNAMRVRFGTYDEERGIESTIRVDANCSMTKFQGRWSFYHV